MMKYIKSLYRKIRGIPTIKVDPIGFIPMKGHADDACEDLRAATDYVVPGWGIKTIATYMRTEIPKGYFGDVRPRSGLSSDGLMLTNACGTIDAGYRGYWYATFFNATPEPIHIKPGQKIVQVRFVKLDKYHYEYSNKLSDSTRGSDGYGSTGSH